MNGRSPIFRLVVLYCLLLLFLGAAFAFITINSFERYTSQTIYREIKARSGEIWQTAKASLGDRDELAGLMELRFAPEAQEHFIQISEGNRILYRSGVPAGVNLAGVISAAAKTESAQVGALLMDTENYETGGGRRVTVISGQSSAFAETVERSLLQSLLFGLPILLVLAALSGYVLMRRALAPIESMIDAAEAITFNNPGTRLPLARTGDRIETLGLALNRMLDRLDSAYQFANRFSVDAAHEIRTPLAIVRGELESIVGNEPSEELQIAHQTILDEVKRLGEMVDNLGMLSQMDSMWGKRAHEQVDLFALAQETMDQMRLLAEAKQITLAPIAGRSTVVAGDRSRLKQVFVNLLDNAIKYTPDGGAVAVEVIGNGQTAELTVRDSGIGIAPEHRDKIFDRFYRISTDRGETGSGLGLSIVKAICNAHGGSIGVVSGPGRGSTFHVQLPLGTTTS